jgi:Uncharacterized conserved protein
MPVKERTFKNKVVDAVLIIIGTFVLAMSVEMFIIPYNILSGGVAGIAVAVEPFFHLDKTLIANALTLILFFVGWAMLGRQFAISTAFSSLLYPIFTTALSWIDFGITVPPMLASFYAGLLGGVGIGLIMRAGASSGGMDVPPLILHKLTGAKISTLVVITDGLTVLLGVLAYDLNAALVGLISVFASGAGIRYVLEVGQGASAKSVQIISEHYREIMEEINKVLDRGVTLIDAQGGYSSQPKKIILCVVSERQYARLLSIIRQTDEHAFVITTDASDMHGEGFTYSSPNI